MSDLHQEYHPMSGLPGGDILFLLGDIWEIFQMLPNKTDSKSRALRKNYIKFIKEELSKYETVLLVKGNHEHYNIFWEDSNKILLGFLKEHDPSGHIKLLDNDSIIIEGVKFIGSTLWATYGYKTINQAAIQVGMPDLHWIKTREIFSSDVADTIYGRNLLVEEIWGKHLNCVEYLRKELAKNTIIYADDKGDLITKSDIPSIVLSHHAPSYLALDETSNFDDAFCSNQHELIEGYKPKIFCYGHTHEQKRFRIGETLLISNPRGYWGYERSARTFDPSAADFNLEDIKE